MAKEISEVCLPNEEMGNENQNVIASKSKTEYDASVNKVNCKLLELTRMVREVEEKIT